MAKIHASQGPSAQDRFLNLLKQGILKLDLAELDFGIYRILNYRRTQVLAYLDGALPGRIKAWTDALAQSSGREMANTEAENCYYHLHTFFARYWDDGDFIPRARRGGSAAYAVPYNGQDTHFHWATKGSHYVKSGELFARYAYKDGAQEVRFVLERAEVKKDNARAAPNTSFQPACTRWTAASSWLGHGAPPATRKANAIKIRAHYAIGTVAKTMFYWKLMATETTAYRPPRAPACRNVCSTPGWRTATSAPPGCPKV